MIRRVWRLEAAAVTPLLLFWLLARSVASGAAAIYASQVSILPNATRVWVEGAELPVPSGGAQQLEMHLSAGQCAQIRILSASRVECEFPGVSMAQHPYTNASVAVLTLRVLAFTIEGRAVLLQSKNNATGVVTNVTSETGIPIATLRPAPVIAQFPPTGVSSENGLSITLNASNLAVAAEMQVLVRSAINQPFVCTNLLAAGEIVFCYIAPSDALAFPAGPILANLIIQNGVSSGWVDIGALNTQMDPVPVTAVAAPIPADAFAFDIKGKYFAPSPDYIQVNLTQNTIAPLNDSVRCEITRLTSTTINCVGVGLSSQAWVAGTLRALISTLTPNTESPYQAGPNPIAVMKPAVRQTPTVAELRVGSDPQLITILGNGFAKAIDISSVTVLWRYEGSQTNSSCFLVSVSPTQIMCQVPANVVAGSIQVFVAITRDIYLDSNDSPDVNGVVLSSGWSSAANLQPFVTSSASLILLSELASDSVAITIQGTGFSSSLVENNVTLSIGTSTSPCSLTRASLRTLVCQVPRSVFSVGSLFAIVSVRGVSSVAKQIAAVASSFTDAPRAAIVQPTSGGAIAAAVVVIIVVLAVAVVGFVFRKQIMDRVNKLKKKQSTPENYASHQDRIPVGEVLSALTPEGDTTEISGAD